MSMDSGELEQRRYNPTLPSGRKKKKAPKKKAPKKPAPRKPAPKVTNSTGGDQPVRVGRAAKQQPKKKLQYIISEGRGMYPPKPKKKKDTRSFGQRVVEAGKTAKPTRGFGQR